MVRGLDVARLRRLELIVRERSFSRAAESLVRSADVIDPSWHRLVGLTLRALAGINPAAQALIDTPREVGGEFGS